MGNIRAFERLLREYGYNGGAISASDFFYLAKEAGYRSKSGARYAFTRLGFSTKSITRTIRPAHLTYPDRQLNIEDIDKVRSLAKRFFPVDIAYHLKLNLRQVFFCLKGQDYIDIFSK